MESSFVGTGRLDSPQTPTNPEQLYAMAPLMGMQNEGPSAEVTTRVTNSGEFVDA